MKIKILIVDDLQVDINSLIGSLIPVKGIPDNDSERISLAQKKYDIKTFKVVGAAIYEITHNNYRPDLALVDINFSTLKQTDLDAYPSNYNLDLKVEKGVKRGREFNNAIENISPKTIVKNITHLPNVGEVFEEVLNGITTAKIIDIERDITKMDKITEAVIPLLKSIILIKLNEYLKAKKQIETWIANGFLLDAKIIFNGLRVSATDFVTPWERYVYENNKIIEYQKSKSLENFGDDLFPETEDIDWNDIKFSKALMKSLNKNGILREYYRHITNYPEKLKKINKEAQQFLDEYIEWYLYYQEDSFTPDANIENLKNHLKSSDIKYLPNSPFDFQFEDSNEIWVLLRNFFIVQRIICTLSKFTKFSKEYFTKEMELLENVVPYLRYKRSGTVDAIDFINKLGLSVKENRYAEFRKPYVMPDIADFVENYANNKQFLE